MSLELCVLGSGSAGNCAVVRSPAGVMLIDAGLGPRVTAKRLQGTGVSVDDVRAICLTHLDSDHFRFSWVRPIVQQGIRVYCHAARAAQLITAVRAQCNGHAEQFAVLVRGFTSHSFKPMPGLSARTIHCRHDDSGSHGLILEGYDSRIGYATDLGRVPEKLIAQFADAHVIALESNYDPRMQLQSTRPWFLKQRIMGGAGHLSNEQAFEALRKILDRAQRKRRELPSHIVLLHRSRQCNCPNLMKRLFTKDARIAARLTLADQFRRSSWLSARPGAGAQLTLSFAS